MSVYLYLKVDCANLQSTLCIDFGKEGRVWVTASGQFIFALFWAFKFCLPCVSLITSLWSIVSCMEWYKYTNWKYYICIILKNCFVLLNPIWGGSIQNSYLWKSQTRISTEHTILHRDICRQVQTESSANCFPLNPVNCPIALSHCRCRRGRAFIVLPLNC